MVQRRENSAAVTEEDADTIEVNVEMRKAAGRSLDESVLMDHSVQLLNEVNNVPATKWHAELRGVGERSGWYRELRTENGLFYSIFIILRGPNGKTVDLDIHEKLDLLSKKGRQLKGNAWLIHTLNGETYVPMSAEERMERTNARNSTNVSYADCKYPSDMLHYFRDMYDVDAQIRVILKPVEKAIADDFQTRKHSVLVGEPGCGKTTALRCIKDAIGHRAVLELDGPSMTSAGVQKVILEAEELPRFIFIEEIEKGSQEAVTFLLGLMDDRAEIRKTTQRGNIQRDAKMVVFATVNNWQKFLSFNDGALASRFQNKVYFRRPTDKMLTQILEREIKRTKGAKKEWIKPALAWCHKVDNLDPRYVISVCLLGGDDLMTGAYQADLEATMLPAEVTGVTINFNGK